MQPVVAVARSGIHHRIDFCCHIITETTALLETGIFPPSRGSGHGSQNCAGGAFSRQTNRPSIYIQCCTSELNLSYPVNNFYSKDCLRDSHYNAVNHMLCQAPGMRMLCFSQPPLPTVKISVHQFECHRHLSAIISLFLQSRHRRLGARQS